MKLTGPRDLFLLSPKDVVAKRNLFELVQYSKVPDSQYWGGADLRIGNTPQQGINWVGHLPACHAVIVKTAPGWYADDGWADEERSKYHYSFKANRGVVSYTEKANSVLVHQQQYLYPILLFTESADSWVYEGEFFVSELEAKYVVLTRNRGVYSALALSEEEIGYQEGGRKYVTHLMAERNREVVKMVKASSDSACDICGLDFSSMYGVEYVEAHHKVPLSTFCASHVITTQDFALLCPNCHKAVHLHMKKQGLEYLQIRDQIRARLVESVSLAKRIPTNG